jgi:hypothetical protein
MKQLLGTMTLLLGLSLLPAMAQSNYQYPDRDRDGRYANQNYQLSPDDQRDFNHEYDKWRDANAKNDRDDIDKHVRRMEDIIARYRIPPDTPFDAIATSGANTRAYDARQYQGKFSHDDQEKFDKAYEHWVEHRRKHDRDDVAKDEGRMQEIMSRYNIPRDVPYDDLASSGRGR